MQAQFIEKRRPKRDPAAMRALKKIMPPLAKPDMVLADVLAAEAKALCDAQELATMISKAGMQIPLSLSDHAPRQMYRDRAELVQPQVHAGQLKLFLSELRFLTEFASGAREPVEVIYAGSAPGIHIPYLANLFPRVKFYLYDPREFCDKVFGLKNVTVIDSVGLRGVRFCQKWANRWCDEKRDPFGYYVGHPREHTLLFISDIRSGDIDDPKCDFEKCCQSDMDAQMNWIRTMWPAASMVKFRLPYLPGTTGYLAPVDDEHLWFGVFAPRGSTELRLVTRGRDQHGSECKMRKYDHTEIEEQTYYFNNFTRVAQYKSTRSHPKKTALGMDNCWDCCAMCEICYKYLCQKYDVDYEPRPEHVIAAIEFATPMLPGVAIIISDYCCTITIDELYDFMTAVVRECNAGGKLHTAPHGDNPKCTPWVDRVGPDGYVLKPLDPKEPMDRVRDEVRRLYEGARRKK